MPLEGGLPVPTRASTVNRLLGFIGLTLGGWVGWAIGMRLSFGAAIFLSILGTAFGLYLGRRIARDHF